MPDKPFISVMILCYNYGEMLKKALDACSRQTFSDFEIIMINNGSTDNTEEVFLNFQKENPGISATYLPIYPNVGPVNAWNEAIHHANGTYVMFHDADDWMDENCLELLAQAAEKSDADRVIGAYREVNDAGKLLRNRTLGRNPIPWTCNMLQANLFRVELFYEHNFCSKHRYHDHERAMFFCVYAHKTAFVDVACYNFLIHIGIDSESKSRDQHKKIWDESWSLDLLLSRFREVYDMIDSETDREWAEYETVRMYYIYIYEMLLTAPLKIKWESYEKLHETMKRHYSHYLKNKKITLFRKEGDQFFSRLAVWGSATAERLHMMKALLLVFHLVAKLTKLYV